jgi:hypothetical protein
MISAGGRAVAMVAAGAILGFCLCEAMHAAIDAYKASAVKHSVADAIVLSKALENYRADTGRYPMTEGQVVSAQLAPRYINAVPIDTFTGRPYEVFMAADSAAVVGVGRGGVIVQAGKSVVFQPYRPGD